MRIIRTFILFICICLPVPASAINVREHILDNGLKLLVLEDHKAPTATFQVWYRVGSRDEQIGKTGLSHLLEHLMFKGTKENGPKTFSQTIQRAGGTDNAFTTHEHTGYFELISSDRISIPLRLEADRMQNLVLTPDGVLSERDVVMEERRLRYDDNPQNLLHEEVSATAFTNHPYRWPVIGWMSDLKTLNPADLIAHYRTYYAPNNAVVIVVGDVDPEAVLTQVRETFGKIPRGPEIKENSITEDMQHGEKRIFVKKEAELPGVIMAFKTPSLKHEDTYALEVLGSILSGGKSSRLHNALVYEKQLALSAWASYENMYRDPYLFLVGGTAAQGREISEVEKALQLEIEKIKNAPPSEYEVKKAKNQIEASFVMEQDSIYMLAKLIGTFEMLGGWQLINTYLEGVRSVTPSDVQRVAKKYLIPETGTTGILVPLRSAKK
ncbi:MAG: insulinase family protein [Nitrospirae bacterium]|nr:MAG: insulinase family protein [Nitrospirota bacterium]